MAVPFTIDRIIPYWCIGIGNVTKLKTVIVAHEVIVHYYPDTLK